MEQSFEKIWNDYHKKLHFFISKKVNDKDLVEDILQEVFIKIHKNINSLNDSDKINSWIYNIANNSVIDFYRSKKSLNELSDDIKQEIEEADNTEKIVASWLIPFISLLSPTYSHTLYLSEVEGLTLKEIAEIENISVSAVKSRVQRGRKELKELLFQCCEFEFDKRGGIIGYKKRNQCGDC